MMGFSIEAIQKQTHTCSFFSTTKIGVVLLLWLVLCML